MLPVMPLLVPNTMPASAGGPNKEPNRLVAVGCGALYVVVLGGGDQERRLAGGDRLLQVMFGLAPAVDKWGNKHRLLGGSGIHCWVDYVSTVRWIGHRLFG